MFELLYILTFALGLALLLKGAGVITDYASRIARALGISQIVIGITIVAIATSLPELAVCVTSAIGGVASIASGTIIGSNISNIALIVGLSALAAPFLTKREFLKQGYFMLGFTVLVALFLIGGLYWFEGLIIISLAVIYLVLLVSFKKRQTVSETSKREKIHTTRYILFCIIGGIGVALGANLLVMSTVEIARWIGVSELIISLIIIAVGTSLPELATSIVAARKKMRGISLGNILGSNIFNIMILGISSLFAVAPVTTSLMLISVPIMLILSVILLYFIKSEHWTITRKEAAILLIIYAVFIALQFVRI